MGWSVDCSVGCSVDELVLALAFACAPYPAPEFTLCDSFRGGDSYLCNFVTFDPLGLTLFSRDLEHVALLLASVGLGPLVVQVGALVVRQVLGD